ncbi:hypothetical protein M5K25_015333 [Dendrobium thyrsiflorum]|uniref:Uncharacterized protein n=1 Tax=Dendrobium thyrsiflorum TaxID=117978 RepID=A0ABD0UQJ1_DENTH
MNVTVVGNFVVRRKFDVRRWSGVTPGLRRWSGGTPGLRWWSGETPASGGDPAELRRQVVVWFYSGPQVVVRRNFGVRRCSSGSPTSSGGLADLQRWVVIRRNSDVRLLATSSSFEIMAAAGSQEVKRASFLRSRATTDGTTPSLTMGKDFASKHIFEHSRV